MEQIITYRSYQEYKQELDTELKKTAEGFVRIGYLLKVARDTNILAESGYKNVVDFAGQNMALTRHRSAVSYISMTNFHKEAMHRS